MVVTLDELIELLRKGPELYCQITVEVLETLADMNSEMVRYLKETGQWEEFMKYVKVSQEVDKAHSA
jgi:hypothetical protein